MVFSSSVFCDDMAIRGQFKVEIVGVVANKTAFKSTVDALRGLPEEAKETALRAHLMLGLQLDILCCKGLEAGNAVLDPCQEIIIACLL